MTETSDTYLLLRAFVDELVRCGVAGACTSPGSRSTPIVLSLVRDGRLRCWSHVDERVAGFFGLGLAKATGRPAVLACTSGTAAAAHWRADLLRNEPGALATALRGLGAGVMEPLWDRLSELEGMPVTIIAGERDGRYAAIGRRLADALPGARLLLVPGAGHGLPREAPQAVAAAISSP